MAANTQSGNTENLSEEAILTFVVDEVNKHLGRNFTLLEFDELGVVPLLTVVADLFKKLSPQSEFNPAETAGRAALLVFLMRTLSYKPGPLIEKSFPQSFISGDKIAIQPALYWVFCNWKHNVKRVHLARFLSRIEDVPEDMRMQDERVAEQWREYERLRGEFVQSHKRLEALREGHDDPTEAIRRIQSLENEKETLAKRLEAAQKKLGNVSNKDSFLAACKQLRTETEDQSRLAEKYAQQQQAKYAAERLNAEIQNRVKHVQRDLQDGRLDSIVRRLRDDIQTSNMKLTDQLPKELNEKRAENAALQNLLTAPLDFDSLHSEINELDQACRELQMKVQERQRPSEDGNSVDMMRQQVKLAVAKKTAVMDELSSERAENDRLLSKLREAEQQINEFREQKVLSGEEFRKYSNQVRSKTATNATMRQKLGDMRAELGVLGYTSGVLEENLGVLRADIRKIEDRLGLRGYSDKVDDLNRVTDEKNAVEEVKGKTLEELSRIVSDTMYVIRERRNKLTPQINELRSQRASAAEVDQEWEQLKSAYELQEGLLMQDVTKIESEVSGLDEENRVNEALFHRMNHQRTLLDAMLQRAKDEREYRAGASSLDVDGCKSYSELMDRTIAGLEGRSKELQRRRREIDENQDNSILQVEYFTTLRKILEVKLRCTKANGPGANGGRAMGGRMGGGMTGASSQQAIEDEIVALMGGNNGGADMLVL